MKYFISLFTISLISMLSFAQTQQGYVKTKGRLCNNGSVIAGQRLPGATVTVRGSNTVLSGSNGTFILSIPGNSYYLQNVYKQGYVLTDPDVLSKQYACSKNPLVLVLESPSQQTDDKLTAERKIRRTLQRLLQDKEHEIESLKEQQMLTEEEYRKQLQEIYTQQESNEKLISEMADRYSRIDFDEVDEFNRKVSQLILDGKLAEADSLLNTKGDINADVIALHHLRQVNAKEKEELTKRQKNLKKSFALEKVQFEELSQRCYSKYEIFKLSQQYDSAAFYLNMRVELDTTNIYYLLEAIDFEKEFISDGWEKTKYERALSISLKLYGEQSWEYALCCNRIGNEISEESYKTADFAEEYLDTAHSIIDNIYGDNHLEMARCYLSYGKMYLSESRGIYSNDSDWEEDVELAKDYFIKAANIFKRLNPTGLLDIAKCYMLLYDVCGDEKYNEMAFNIYKSINKGQNAGTAFYYYQKGMKYYEDENLYTPSLYGYWFENISKFDDHTAIRKEIRNYKKSIPLLRKAQDIYVKVHGINYPMVDEIDYIIDQIEAEIHIFNQALNYKEPFQILNDLWTE